MIRALDLIARGVMLGAVVALPLALPSPARAADLGGNCCADLEARVAALEATTVTKGNKKVSLTVSGRVNTNLMWWQDNASGSDPSQPFDKKSGVNFGNTANNETRFSFDGSSRLSSDVTVGFRLSIKDDPFGQPVQNSQLGSQAGPFLYADTDYVFAKSDRLGEYRLGYLPSASDDAYYVDYGAAGTVGGLYGTRFVGGYFLRGGISPGALTDVTYGSVIGELADVNADRLMYISPTWAGFTYKSDVGSDTGSVALTWSGSTGSLRGAFGVGYERSTGWAALGLNTGPGNPLVQVINSATVPLVDANHDLLRQLAMSASVMETKSGLFLTGEYSRAYSDISGRDDATNWFARAGWTKNVTGLGATIVDVQYERTDNKLANDTSGHLWGAGIDQAIDAVASNIYLHYQHDSFDAGGVIAPTGTATGGAIVCPNNAVSGNCTVGAQSIDSLTAGMIVNF